MQSADKATSPIQSELTVQFAGDNAIEFGGVSFEPDQAKGFFQFAISHAFPSLLVYGTGLVAPVIARSYKSLLHQNVNYEHQLAQYYDAPGEPNNVDDRIIGSIVAVSFPPPDAGGYLFVYPTTQTPAITGVASFFKRTKGMKKIVGEHLTGRHSYTVSMEVEYPFGEAGFAIAMKNGKPAVTAEFTPKQMLDSGWEYVPFKSAPDDLKATFSRKKNRIVSQYRGRQTGYLMGGLDQEVLYAGLAVVKWGAEPPAKITRVTASSDIAAPFANFAELLSSILRCQKTNK